MSQPTPLKKQRVESEMPALRQENERLLQENSLLRRKLSYFETSTQRVITDLELQLEADLEFSERHAEVSRQLDTLIRDIERLE